MFYLGINLKLQCKLAVKVSVRRFRISASLDAFGPWLARLPGGLPLWQVQLVHTHALEREEVV